MFFKNSLFVFHEKKKSNWKKFRTIWGWMTEWWHVKLLIKKKNRRPVPLNTNRKNQSRPYKNKDRQNIYIYVYKRQRYSLNSHIPAKRWNAIFTELEFSRCCLLYIKCRKTVSPEEVHNGAQRAQKQQRRIVVTVKVYSLHFYAWCM